MALTRKRKDSIDTTLTIKGQGESVTLQITYHNRRQSEVEAVLKDDDKTVTDVVLFIVKEWDSEYELSIDGVKEMEDDRPGMVMALIAGFHEAREVQKEKN